MWSLITVIIIVVQVIYETFLSNAGYLLQYSRVVPLYMNYSRSAGVVHHPYLMLTLTYSNLKLSVD